MGTRAERLTGYFATSASKRAASCGEKMVMVSLLIASTPVPIFPRPYPSRFPHSRGLGLIAVVLLRSIQALRFVHLRAAILPERRVAQVRAIGRRGER